MVLCHLEGECVLELLWQRNVKIGCQQLCFLHLGHGRLWIYGAKFFEALESCVDNIIKWPVPKYSEDGFLKCTSSNKGFNGCIARFSIVCKIAANQSSFPFIEAAEWDSPWALTLFLKQFTQFTQEFTAIYRMSDLD